MKATDGYSLSKPIGRKTDLIYIDNMKIYVSIKRKFETVINMVNDAMEDTGLHWNKKKCALAHVKKGCLVRSEGMKIGPVEVIESLKEGTHYKFLGVLENIRQEGNLTLDSATKVYQQRLSVILSSPLSDYNKVLARNLFAVPVLTYLMWMQVWPIAELKRLDRASRKVMIENGAKHASSGLH